MNIQYFFKKMSCWVLLLNVLAMGSVATSFAQEPIPSILISASEIDAIKVKVAAGEEPWKSAYDQVIAQANAVEIPKDANGNEVGYSVTFGGEDNNAAGCRGDGRVFCAGGFYEDENRYDANQAIAVGAAVRDLGMAYAFSGNAEYAEKLIKLVRVWSIDPATSLLPRFVTNGAKISLFSNQGGVIYGAGLAWDYPGWQASDKEAFTAWVQALGEAVEDFSPADNNFENWRNALLSIAGAFTGDQNLLDASFQNFRNAIPGHIHWTGRMNWEYGRTDGWGGLGYSVFAITAMTITAEVARLRNVDLYNYTSDGTRGLRVALDFLAPYIADPSLWGNDSATRSVGVGQLYDYRTRGSGVYEVAYSIWEDPDYLAVITQVGRPSIMAHWAPGVITLTHANRFVAPSAPNITTQPEPITITEGEDATFSVAVTGSAPLTYQWFRDNALIVSATTASYTLTGVTPSDDGSVYHCEITNNLGSVSSSGAVLTVVSDTTAPTLLSAFATSDTRIDLTFSEPVSISSAESISNYQIDAGIAVSAARLSDDGLTVSLTVTSLTEGSSYTLQVRNVQDRAATPNSLVSSSQAFTYLAADGFEDGTADGWSPRNASNWQVKTDGGDQAYYLKSNPGSPGGNRLGEYSLLPGSYGDFTLTAQARLGGAGISNAAADYAVVFGFQDDNNYYYALFNNNTSYTGLFKVSDGSRAELTTPGSVETDWLTDNLYHRISVSRTGSNITVHFDGNLVMSVTDSTFGAGKVGVGSLNDTAYFDDINVSANASGEPANSAPTAASASITTVQDTASDGVTPQVTDPDAGDTHTLSIVSQPTNGSAQVIDNKLVYTPDSGFVGGDSFQFSARDSGGLSVTGTASVTVSAGSTDGGNNGDGNSSDESSGGGTLGPLLGLSLMLLAFAKPWRRRHRSSFREIR